MRWNLLDYCLLSVVVLSGLITWQNRVHGADCELDRCAPLVWFASDNPAPVGIVYYEWKQLDCSRCKHPAGNCQWGAWAPNCRATDVDQELLTLGSAVLVCDLPVGGNAEAEPPII